MEWKQANRLRDLQSTQVSRVVYTPKSELLDLDFICYGTQVLGYQTVFMETEIHY